MSVFSMTAEEQAALNRVVLFQEQAEKMVHKDFRGKAEHYYRLYRGYQQMKSAWLAAGPNDRDGVVYDAGRAWGAELFIPYAYGTVEVIVPRAVSQRPRMLVLPRNQDSEANVEPVRLMIDAQQEQIDYELVLQDVLRTGMIYGIGVQKTPWRTEYAQRRQIKRATLPKRLTGSGQYVLSGLETVCTFDDPTAEWVDPFDFFWDPFAHTIERCSGMVHRTWRSTAYCLERLKVYGDRPADWNTEAAGKLDEDTIRAMGSGQEYSQIWTERMLAAGHRNFDVQGEQLHEVWEFHDGQEILTVLDKQLLVRRAENPTLGKVPFQVYRPTRVPGEMVGIGEIEPIEHLQLELNTLRSQRRDNATLKLMQSYAIDVGVVDADDVIFGPGTLIPINGAPREALYPLNVGDIPNSSYQEEAAIVNDIQRVSGIDDTVSGGDAGAQGTATGVQLVQAAANMRIQNKSRRLEVEVIRPAARQFLALSQRMIIEQRDIRVPVEPGIESDPNEKRWQWFPIGPEELRGEFEIVPEGGSTQPENTPQDRQDAQMAWNMFANNPGVDQQQLLKFALGKIGIKHPETWLSAPDRLPPVILDKIRATGLIPDEVLSMIVQQAQAENPTSGQEPASMQPAQPPEQAQAA